MRKLLLKRSVPWRTGRICERAGQRERRTDKNVGEPKRLGDAVRRLLQPTLFEAEPDHRRQRRQPSGRLDVLHRRAARPRGRASGHRRYDVCACRRSRTPSIALDLNDDGSIKWDYQPNQDPNVIPVMCCDTVNRGVAYADGKIFLYQADTTLVALDAETGKEVWKVKYGDPVDRRDRHQRTARDQGQGPRRHIGRRIRRPRLDDRLQHQGRQAGMARLFSMGPDSDTLMDPEKTTHLGKPVGKDSGTATWEGDQWKIGGGTTWGWYSYDPGSEPRLLRHRQSLDLEPEPASWRQSLVDDHLRPRRRYRDGQVGLPDDAP